MSTLQRTTSTENDVKSRLSAIAKTDPEEIVAPCIVNWAWLALNDEESLVNEVTLLDEERVESSSKFAGLTNPTTVEDWIAKFHYIILKTIGSSGLLHQSELHVAAVAREGAALMKLGTTKVNLKVIYEEVFASRCAPIAMVLNSWIDKIGKNRKVRSPEISTIARLNLLIKLVKRNVDIIKNTRFWTMPLVCAQLAKVEETSACSSDHFDIDNDCKWYHSLTIAYF